MITDVTLFNSKVARRIFVLLLLSALAPVGLFAVLTFNQVTRHISSQTQQQLQQNAKSISLDIIEKLTDLNRELEQLGNLIAASPTLTTQQLSNIAAVKYQGFFTSLGLTSPNDPYTVIYGTQLEVPQLSDDQLDRIESGTAVLISLPTQNRKPRFVMIKPQPSNNGRKIWLVSEINPDNLWNIQHTMPVNGEFCVFGSMHNPIYCSGPKANAQSLRNKLVIINPSIPQFFWENNGVEYTAFTWPVFLENAFGTGDWTVIFSFPSKIISQPLFEFRNILISIVALSFLFVAYLGSRLAHKNIGALKKIKAGTERLSEGDFQTKVIISSGDEYEELAASFNDMANRLDKQFTSLQILSEVDRIMLSSLDANYILETVMDRIKDITSCQRTLIFKIKNKSNGSETRFDLYNLNKTQSYFRDTIVISPDDEHTLENHPRYLFVQADLSSPRYLQPLVLEGGKSFIIFPVFLRERLFALVVLVYKKTIRFDDYDFRHARELADRIAVALTNADWEEKVYRQTNYDVLTDLPNRNLLMDRLDQSIQRARRDGTQVAILLIDLDRFKAINDSMGHGSGDTLLRRVADRFKKIINSTDTLVRFGGDEFVVIMADIKYHTNAVTIISYMAEQILDTLTRPFDINDHEINISASIGISLYPSDSRNPSDLLKFAESSMYHSKSHNKGFYQFYSSDINATSFAQLIMENDLRYAINREELELYFQPKMDLYKGEIVGAEALLRWNHPKSGIILPTTFLPLAENTGLYGPLSNWVIEQVCRQLRLWLDADLPATKIAVNLSAHQFKTENLPEKIQFQLHKYKLDVSCLELEITEDTVMSDIDNATQTLQQLNRIGAQLAIDDFGTGYSSLSYLTKFPIQYLKIDQSFIREAPDNKSVNSVISATIAMAHSLNMKVIAEGVENKAQLEFLKTLGCDIVQGYLISKPLKASEYIELVSKSTSRFIASSN